MLPYGLNEIRKPIRVAICGIGCMGKGLAHQARITPGIECVALADIRLERATACADFLGREYRVAHSLDELHAAIDRSQMAICEDGDLLARCDLVDVFIEASGSTMAGGQLAATAIEHGKHAVMMNAEADLAFGPYLMQLARDNSVVYSSCGGDQPVVIRHLIDELELWGFELVMAGNIKGFLDRYSDPTKIIPEADKRNLDYKMASSYTDGTKLCIEMALVANAHGLATPVPGMLGPKAGHVREVLGLYDLDALRRSGPVVDYILGAEPNGGVFAVGYCDNAYQQGMLSGLLKMGQGPYYVFYRPYHLCHVEGMSTVAEAHLLRRAQLQPTHGFRTNVYAYAKRDLSQGQRLDGCGGYACYGLIENCNHGDANPGLPICLAEDVRLKRDVRRDERICVQDIDHDPHRADFVLYDKALACSQRMHA